MTEKKINTQDRKVQAYLPPLYFRYFQAYVGHTGESESAAATHMIKNFLDNMPAQEKAQMLKFGGNGHSKNSY